MAKLFLLRHLKSQWNLENRFAGWVDIPLSKEGADQASIVANEVKGVNFDIIYSSGLIRNIQTVIKILKNIGDKYPLFKHLDGGLDKWDNFEGGGNFIKVYVSNKLNERSYGKVQGLNKANLMKEYGEEKVHSWRRDYNDAPPSGESGKDVYKRVVPFFKKNIEKDLKNGKNVLLVASHGSLRVVIKYLENMSDADFGNLELPFGALIKYDFDGKNYTHLQ